MTVHPMLADSPHGAGGYTRGCRCETCREAKRTYQRRWLGTASGKESRNATARRQRKTVKGRRYHAAREHVRRRQMDGEAAEYVAILLGDPCSYCGQPANSVDHIEPVSLGGSSDWDNLTAACRSCNSRKGIHSLLNVL